MQKEVWIAGYPSVLGGADTELLHLLDLFRLYQVETHLVPMFGHDNRMRAHCTAIGCITHPYRPSIFKDKTVVSYCNGNFLAHLHEIVERGKPRHVVWFNCMTTPFQKEIECHKKGWIDLHGFVSAYQRSLLQPEIEKHGRPVAAFEGYRPYFNPDNAAQKIEFSYKAPDQWFAVGRLSRDDGNKYPHDLWQTFYKVCVPKAKKIFVLGYGPNAMRKCGSPPAGMDWQVWKPNEVPVSQFYHLLHCLIHKTGGSRESYCRIVPEAYAFGVPVVVEHNYAFPEIVVHGVTGFMCKSSDEMAFRASELAFDEERRKKVIQSAREHLLNEISSPALCWKPWQQLLE
jgi:glycosyltransferase involved in cell wall biosynthesis